MKMAGISFVRSFILLRYHENSIMNNKTYLPAIFFAAGNAGKIIREYRVPALFPAETAAARGLDDEDIVRCQEGLIISPQQGGGPIGMQDAVLTPLSGQTAS